MRATERRCYSRMMLHMRSASTSTHFDAECVIPLAESPFCKKYSRGPVAVDELDERLLERD